jgi:hypothetical protein
VADDTPTPRNDAGGRAARVRQTGIALVHEGELVLPAAGSEAQAAQVADDAASIIHYHFPVEIEVRAAPEALDREVLIAEVFDRLVASLDALG